MFKEKKAIGLITTSIIIGVIVLTGIFIVPQVIAPTPKLCDEENYDYRCICADNQVKRGFFPWYCEDLPKLPTEVTFPIETWEEATAYAKDLMGGFSCTGEFFYEGILTGEIYKQCGKYGSVITRSPSQYMGHIISLECKSIEEVYPDGSPKSGHIVWDVEFDPNDGHIVTLKCNENFISNCPELEFEQNYKESTEPTCGDGCCHFGETFENCPQDCEGPPIESQDCCGDGFCAKNRVQTNYCNVNGVSTALRRIDCAGSYELISLSQCDGYDEIINGVRQVRSWARITYETETYENCFVDCESQGPTPPPEYEWVVDSDTILTNAYNRYSWTDRKCAGGIQGFGYCGSSISKEGGCSSYSTIDLVTVSCNELSNALFCGKITVEQFKETVVSRNMRCYPYI